MIPRIRNLETLDEYKLRVEFDDGKTVVYDVYDDIKNIPSYSPLVTVYRLFEQVNVDQSRTVVYWNDEIDLPSDMIYEFGVDVTNVLT